MSDYGLIEEDEAHPYTVKLKWYHNFGDFANLFKAFIGTNYLSLSFGFKQSGLVPGLIGLALVSLLTDHTCILIVRCKRLVIDDICAKYMQKCTEEKDDSELAMEQTAFLRKRLEKNLQYADVGRICFGAIGSFLVNLFVIITQVGFCIGYAIFVGNTLHHLLPSKGVSGSNMSDSWTVINEMPQGLTSVHIIPANDTDVVKLFDDWVDHDDVDNNHRNHRTKRDGAVHPGLTQPLWSEDFVNRARRREPEDPAMYSNSDLTTMESTVQTASTSTVQPASTSTVQPASTYTVQPASTSTVQPASTYTVQPASTSTAQPASTSTVQPTNTSTVQPASTSTAQPTNTPSVQPTNTSSVQPTNTESDSRTSNSRNVTTTVSTTETTTTMKVITTTEAINMSKQELNETEVYEAIREGKVWPLYLLVIIPLPIFIFFTLFRHLRQMSVISVLANAAVIVGFCSLLLYIWADFHVSPTVSLFEWATLPVFIGQVIAAYEAIGTILPIESSMEGNRHQFSLLLHITVVVFTLVIGTIAVMGYLRYGAEIQQILAQNIPPDSPVIWLIDATLIFGVVCTYPLQIYPVVEILEGLLFAEGRLCGPVKKVTADSLDSSDEDFAEESLLSSEADLQLSLPVAVFVPKSVPAWKRNLFRSAIALGTTGIAILLRNVFAYTGALVGALGSCPLAFILPCLFHIKLRHTELSRLVIAKDCAIITFGTVACVVSVAVSLQEMVENI